MPLYPAPITETQISLLRKICENTAEAAANPPGSSAQGGVVTLNQGDTSKAVVFGTPFAAAPSVVGQIHLPNANGPGISWWVDETTRTTTGVTFVFGDAIPAAGYKLSWHAI